MFSYFWSVFINYMPVRPPCRLGLPRSMLQIQGVPYPGSLHLNFNVMEVLQGNTRASHPQLSGLVGHEEKSPDLRPTKKFALPTGRKPNTPKHF